MLTTSIVPINATNVNMTSDSISTREEAVNLYNSYLETTTYNENSTAMYSLGEQVADFEGDFAALNLMSGANADDYSTVYSKNTEDMLVTILKNNTTNALSLIEADTQNKDVLFSINDEHFKIVGDSKGNINLVSEAGNILPMIEVTEITAPIGEASLNNAPQLLGMPTLYYGPYGKESAPVLSNNKAKLIVLSYILDAAGWASIILKHPIIGTISLVVSSIATVGESLTVTLYTKRYTSFNATFTYILERTEWYQHSDYHGLIKTTYVEIYNIYAR